MTLALHSVTAGWQTTLEDLTLSVDYNDGSAVDPPGSVIFYSQADIDTFLAVNSATNFKHLEAVWYALPEAIAHDVTINLAAGVHRPRPVGASSIRSFYLSGKRVVHVGTFTIQGSTTYDTLVASQAITDVQLASSDPYVDVAGTPFAGLDLRGTFAVLSTGQKVIIHDHTDSRLYLCDTLSPDPTGGSVVVAQPSTVLRNSQDDIATFRNGTFVFEMSGNFFVNRFMTDVLVDPFGNSAVSFAVGSDTVLQAERVILDQLSMIADFSKTPNGNGFQTSTRASFTMYSCSFRGVRPATGGADAAISCATDGSLITLHGCYIGGSEDGVFISARSIFNMFHSVLDAVGVVSAGTIRIINTSVFGFFDFLGGKANEIRNSSGIAVSMDKSSTHMSANELVFKNCAQPCITIGNSCTINLTNGGVVDAGGNADVGIEVTGSHNVVTLATGVTVTGSVADLRIEGVTGSYGSLGTIAAPTITTGLNSIGRG